MEQNREPEMGPQQYGQLIFDKAGKTIRWKKDSFFNKWYWKNWTAMCKRMKLDHSLTSYTKINKMDERSKCETRSIRILEENTATPFLNLATATSCKIPL